LLSGVTTIRTSASANEVPLQVQNTAALGGTFKTASIDLIAVNGDARLLAGNENSGLGTNGFLALHTRTSETLTEKVRITSSGSVGIGTSTPNASGILHVNKSQNLGTSVFVTNDSTGVSAFASFRAGLNPSNFSTDYFSGTIAGTNFSTIGILKAKTGLLECFGSNLVISNYNDTEPIIFATTTSRTERMRLTAAGRLLLGTTTESTFLLDVNGTARVSGNLTLGTTPTIQSTTGNIIFTSVDVPSRTLTFDTTNNILSFSNFATQAYVGLKFYGPGNPNSFVSPDGINDVGSSKITSYDANGNASINASNNGNRSIVLKGLGANGSVLIGAITTGNGTQYNAILRCDSTTQGFMPPRMTTTQKNAIGTPTAGLQVYDTTLNQMSYYNGTSWVNF
jgi:hypothetical protein